MPVTVNSLKLSDILTDQNKQQIIKLYNHSHEFNDDGEFAYKQLVSAVEQGDCYYVAMFNDKIIGSIWSSGSGEKKLLKHIVVHPANRGRGIADRLVSEVCRLEETQGIQQFEPYCSAIRVLLQRLGKFSD